MQCALKGKRKWRRYRRGLVNRHAPPLKQRKLGGPPLLATENHSSQVAQGSWIPAFRLEVWLMQFSCQLYKTLNHGAFVAGDDLPL